MANNINVMVSDEGGRREVPIEDLLDYANRKKEAIAKKKVWEAKLADLEYDFAQLQQYEEKLVYCIFVCDNTLYLKECIDVDIQNINLISQQTQIPYFKDLLCMSEFNNKESKLEYIKNESETLKNDLVIVCKNLDDAKDVLSKKIKEALDKINACNEVITNSDIAIDNLLHFGRG